MKPSVFENALVAQSEQEAAISWARSKLIASGHTYPTKGIHRSILDFYDALKVYGEMEAAFVREYFTQKKKDAMQLAPKMKDRKLIPAKPIALPYYDD